ncbi:MAG: 2-oxo acid dehydrogenase subunit E2 [Chloroflexi bacterium]|nr:2-oxo acid dehydrogenase subunit E2 [Chloroflexota bacterium]
MAFEITLPRLGWDMQEGSLAEWLKQDGDYVKVGEPLFSIEGDKAVQEIESLDSGYLRRLPDGPRPGEKVPVGTLLGYLVPEEELASFVPSSRIPAAATTPPASQTEAQTQSAEPEPSQSAHAQAKRIYISPYARRLAETMGVDWRLVQGSGARGRIMANDVRRQAERRADVPRMTASVPPSQAASRAKGVSATSLRKKIAEHMAHSAHTSAPVTLTTEVDATELTALRASLKSASQSTLGSPIPSYNDMLVKLCAQALTEHPAMNARLEGDEVLLVSSIHIALAVDTDRGLIVPVIKDAQSKSLRQIAQESATLIEKTRNGTIGFDDLQGATFTITNLGMFGIDAFTPIVDLPQCAILGVGRIAPKQVVVDADKPTVAIRQRVVLSLTFDHRLVDGAQAARFLQRVTQLIEIPYLWIAG